MTDGREFNRQGVYRIEVKGSLDRKWSDWFDGFTITPQTNDETLLTGPVADQAALHGLLAKIRDLGLPLLSVKRVETESKIMVRIEKATTEDAERLTETQTRTFQDDNKLKPPGCNMGGPPGYDSVDWNAGWIEKTPYYKILLDDQIVGGIIVFELGEKRYELGRIWVDPDFQNRGIGQQAVKQMFEAFPEVQKWILGTPSWAIRNQHFYEKMGFVRVRETEVDPALGWSGIEYEKNCT